MIAGLPGFETSKCKHVPSQYLHEWLFLLFFLSYQILTIWGPWGLQVLSCVKQSASISLCVALGLVQGPSHMGHKSCDSRMGRQKQMSHQSFFVKLSNNCFYHVIPCKVKEYSYNSMHKDVMLLSILLVGSGHVTCTNV